MISLVIAAYNEEDRLPETLRRIDGFMSAQAEEYEIIVVDDGSKDGTVAAVREMACVIPNCSIISYDRNRGKGYALRTGVLASLGDRVLISDADLSTPIEELATLLPLLSENHCDVAIGSRALAMSMIIKKQPWWRQGMGRIFNRIVRLLVLDGFSDTQCGFKLFAGDIARKLFSRARIDRFAFDVEIIAMALEQGYRVKEVPITWVNSPDSRVHPLRDSLQMLKDLVRLRIMLGTVRAPARKRPVAAAGFSAAAPVASSYIGSNDAISTPRFKI